MHPLKRWKFAGIATLFFIASHAALAAEGTAGTPPIEKLDPNFAAKDATGAWHWYDAKALTLEGKGWAETERYYGRLPAYAQGKVPDPVWSLGRHSAGLCVRFVTDSAQISARWTVLNKDLAMPHMPATGVSGLDLYVRLESGWRWIANGRPHQQTNELLLAGGIPEGTHEYLLYLPLYNGTDALEIGIKPEASISQAPARPAAQAKPVLIYGTSITQGGCASRPGMAYPAILGRQLDRPVINLGFSGNGRMELELQQLIAEIDAAVYVLDCLPNLNAEEVAARVEPFVVALRAAHPDTPIVLMENIEYQAAAFLAASKADYTAKNAALQAAYDRLLAQGIQGLTYVPGEPLLGSDGEGTVDGVHPTDLGFLRIAESLAPVLRKVLGTP